MTAGAPPPPAPPLRTLGRTGLLTPPLGFGVSGALGTRLMSDRDVAALVRQAISRGVRMFDTAPFYGAGLAERRLGAAIVDTPRDDLILLTKAGTVRVAGRTRKNFAPDHLRASLEASLERLGVVSVDVFLLHGLPAAEEADAALATLRALQAEGRTAHVGACVRGEAEMARALSMDAFDVLMAPARIDQGAEITGQWARARRVAPLTFGGWPKTCGRSRMSKRRAIGRAWRRALIGRREAAAWTWRSPPRPAPSIWRGAWNAPGRRSPPQRLHLDAPARAP